MTKKEGSLTPPVCCRQCENESARVDSYLDIPLVVRPFGASQAYTSVVSLGFSQILTLFFSPLSCLALQVFCAVNSMFGIGKIKEIQN